MKSRLIITITLFAVSLSGQATTVSMETCAAIEDPVERLACYDTLAKRLPADTVKASETAPGAFDPVAPGADVVEPAVPTAAPTEDAEAVFGFERKQKSKKERPDELQLKWTGKTKDAYGKWLITMENGQVWRVRPIAGVSAS